MMPGSKTKSLQRRRANVQRQLALWSQENPRQYNLWQDFDPDSKKAFIVALARVIAKAACPPSVSQIKEGSHER
jgi:hypothetical protein